MSNETSIESLWWPTEDCSIISQEQLQFQDFEQQTSELMEKYNSGEITYKEYKQELNKIKTQQKRQDQIRILNEAPGESKCASDKFEK